MFSSSKITTQGRLYSQTEIDHLFNSAIVLPNIIYGLSVYGAADSELTTIQRFLDHCHKRRYISKHVHVRNLWKSKIKRLLRMYPAGLVVIHSIVLCHKLN